MKLLRNDFGSVEDFHTVCTEGRNLSKTVCHRDTHYNSDERPALVAFLAKPSIWPFEQKTIPTRYSPNIDNRAAVVKAKRGCQRHEIDAR